MSYTLQKDDARLKLNTDRDEFLSFLTKPGYDKSYKFIYRITYGKEGELYVVLEKPNAKMKVSLDSFMVWSLE